MNNDLEQWNGWVMLTRSFDFYEIPLPKLSLLYCYDDDENYIKTRFNGHLIRFDKRDNEYRKIDISEYVKDDTFLNTWKPMICCNKKPSKAFLDQVFYLKSRCIPHNIACEMSALSLKEGVLFVPRQPIMEFYREFDKNVWERFNKIESEHLALLSDLQELYDKQVELIESTYTKWGSHTPDEVTFIGITRPTQYNGKSILERLELLVQSLKDEHHSNLELICQNAYDEQDEFDSVYEAHEEFKKKWGNIIKLQSELEWKRNALEKHRKMMNSL